MRRMMATLACALGLAWAGGCAFGPKTLERTHGRYAESVRCVYEEQLLRDIVHLRYTEGPLDLDVATIAAQYELSAMAEARPFFSTEATGNLFRSFRAILPDVQLSGAERPTLSLSPQDDGAAVRRFLTPIPPSTLILLARTGWPVSTVLRLWVERSNGVPNAVPGSLARGSVPDFARFQRLAELFESAQSAELLSIHPRESTVEVSGPLPREAVTAQAAVEAAKNSLEYRPRGDGKTWALVRKESKLVLAVRPGAEASPEIAEIVQILNLRPGERRYELVVRGDPVPDPLRFPRPPDTEVRVNPRSTAQVLFYLANGVEVPAAHLDAGLVQFPVDATGEVFDARAVTRGLFEVHVCKGLKPPPAAYAAVKYRGYWYYIDDSDLASKSTLALMLQMTRLDLARQHPGGPALTLPVGR
jgi:hypothetical protein